jgi:hypothetical protein
MPLIILTFIVQCCFVYHVFKTRRPAWWAYVILAAPVLGCIAYYFVEIFPGSREHLVANRATRDIARALNPDKDLKGCLEAVEVASLARLAYADARASARGKIATRTRTSGVGRDQRAQTTRSDP